MNSSTLNNTLTPDATSAQPTTAALSLEQRMRQVGQRGLWVVALWLLAFAAWAVFAPISGGVVTSGLVKVEANRRTVSHRDGGTVARILVHEGQRVERGQVLIELDDVRLDASVDLLRSQWAADRLRQSRLEAELAGAAHWAAPPNLAAEFRDVKRFAELANRERAAFDARTQNLRSQIEGDQRQAQDTQAEIDIRLRERDNAHQAVALMKEELAQNQALEQAQFSHRARVMTLQRGVSEYESRLWSNEAELSQARQRLASLDSHQRSLRDNHRQAVTEELREVASRLGDTEQRLRASRDDQGRQTVLAPEAGRLLNLRINTPGSAIGPREPIVDIVPSDAPLRVEARVPLEVGADIGPGTPAELKVLTAQGRYGKLLPAEVVQVSADALQDERGGAYLVAWLQVPAEALQRDQVAWQPGLAVEVYLKISERSPLGFLLEPITGYFRRAFREH